MKGKKGIFIRNDVITGKLVSKYVGGEMKWGEVNQLR